MKLKDCPFCGVKMHMLGDSTFWAEHPDNDCWVHQLVMPAGEWNRRVIVESGKPAPNKRSTPPIGRRISLDQALAIANRALLNAQRARRRAVR